MAQGLAGRIALVTGASSGIGQATALALANAGAAVTVVARRGERLRELAKQIESAGTRALALPCDVSIESDAIQAVASTVAHFGRIDVLINSAGIMQAGGVVNCNLHEYRRVFDVNLFATLYTCQAAVPHMISQGGGDIITISSLAGRKGGPFTSAYSASKHAVNKMTDAMRQELGDRNIRVCTLMPGATTTAIGDNITDPNWRRSIQDHVKKEGAVLPSEIGDTIVYILVLPRRVNVSEIAIRPTIDTTA
jgi:NADP-dependent 3-hydroxy acid dehydrogenase YdfG